MKTIVTRRPLTSHASKIYQTVLLASCLSLSITATAAQRCSDKMPASTPDSRFEILGDGSELKDKQTGLIWQRCVIGQQWDAKNKTCLNDLPRGYNWQDALDKAQALGNGYRLPNIKELASIVERKCVSPALNTTLFPNAVGAVNATSTPVPGKPGYVFHVDLGIGADGVRDMKRVGALVRAVR